MSLSLNISQGSSGGVAQFGTYNPLVRFIDDGLTGSSLKSDGATNADGTLYPATDAINNNTNI